MEEEANKRKEIEEEKRKTLKMEKVGWKYRKKNMKQWENKESTNTNKIKNKNQDKDKKIRSLEEDTRRKQKGTRYKKNKLE